MAVLVGHNGFFGMTLSGKSTLMIERSQRYVARGVPRIILDPMNDPRWKVRPGVDVLTDEPEEFTRLWKENTQCALFIDETGRTVGRYAGEMQEVVTLSRHFGHEAHLSCQRPQQMDPVFREQMVRVYLFTCSVAVSRIFAEEFNQPELLKAGELQQGEFILAERFNVPRKCRIDFATGRVSFVGLLSGE